MLLSERSAGETLEQSKRQPGVSAVPALARLGSSKGTISTQPYGDLYDDAVRGGGSAFERD